MDLSQPGWAVSPVQPDLTRARLLSFVIVANQGSPVSGQVYLDDVVLTEAGGPVDPAQTPAAALAQRLARRQFDALWGARDRSTGLLPAISTYENVMAVNVTAAMVKSLPVAVAQGWISSTAADGYVAQAVQTLGTILNQAAYLPARYVDRVSLQPTYAVEESSVDAAFMYLALYQYKSLSGTPAGLRTDIEQVLGRFDFKAFATLQGWKMSYDPAGKVFSTAIYDGYSGEIGLISLAAHLAGQVDIAALYHSGVNRTAVSTLDSSASYLVHSSADYRSPFVQWLFPLFVDVSQRGPDNYPVSTLASNPLDNATRYQRNVDARLAAVGRAIMLQPDAGDDYTGTVYHAYSVFNSFGKPTLFMPWSVSSALLGDPSVAGPALQQLLVSGLHGPFGLVDSAYWNTGDSGPTNVAARSDLWNVSLSLMALDQYLYHDNQFLTSVPAVGSALGEVFHAPAAVSPPVQFLMDQARLGCTSHYASDLGSPIAPIYTDAYSGVDYFSAFYAGGAMSLDANDPDAAAGRSSVRATWGTTDTYGWFEFHVAGAAPRAAVGSAHTLRFMAKGNQTGQKVHVKVLLTGLPDVTADVTLATAWQDYAVALPAGVQASGLSGVQFVFDALTPRVAGFTTLHVDEVRLDTDAFDPVRVIQSYLSAGWASSGADYNVYPNRSFLYDNALAIKALWATGDAVARGMAQSLADALMKTGLASGSYYNVRSSGPALAGDGTPRAPWSQRQTLGDNAWLGLALLDLSTRSGAISLSDPYLKAAQAISDWAEANLKAGGPLGGYRGGYDDSGAAIAWRSTEHNIDYFALNWYLSAVLRAAGDAADADVYLQRAYHAGDFVMAMYDPVGRKFWTGTGTGDTVNTDAVPLDVQLWAGLALPLSPRYAALIDWQGPITWAETNLQTADGVYSGFTFSDHSTPHRVWLEGTGQAAVVYVVRGDMTKYATMLDNVEYARLEHPNSVDGGVVAASSDGLTDPLGAAYDARSHVGATAWLVFAHLQINPLAPLNPTSFVGTSGDDTFTFTAGGTWHQVAVTLSGGPPATYRYPASGNTNVTFDGLGGNDSVTLNGGPGDETADLHPDHGTLTGTGYSVSVSNVESITANSGGGNDQATLHDGPQADTFIGYPTLAVLTGPGVSLWAIGFRNVTANATAGGQDVARLYDSGGDDTFTAYPTYATLTDGTTYSNRANDFRYATAYATHGGTDAASFFDSPGNDTFTADPRSLPTYATMTGTWRPQGASVDRSYYNRAGLRHVSGDFFRGRDDGLGKALRLGHHERPVRGQPGRSRVHGRRRLLQPGHRLPLRQRLQQRRDRYGAAGRFRGDRHVRGHSGLRRDVRCGRAQQSRLRQPGHGIQGGQCLRHPRRRRLRPAVRLRRQRHLHGHADLRPAHQRSGEQPDLLSH